MVVLNPAEFSIEVTYTKDDLFDCFEVRIWEDGDDKEEAEIFRAEGLGTGPYTIWIPRMFRTAVGTTWHCEVRVRNTDGQPSDWEGDSVVAVPTELSILEQDGVYVASDFLTRDGETELSDDWDAGPHQILCHNRDSPVYRGQYNPCHQSQRRPSGRSAVYRFTGGVFPDSGVGQYCNSGYYWYRCLGRHRY